MIELRNALRRADWHAGIVDALCREAGIDPPAVDRPADRDELAAARTELLSLAGALADRGRLTAGDLLGIDAIRSHVDVIDQRLALADAIHSRTIPAPVRPGDEADALLLVANLID